METSKGNLFRKGSGVMTSITITLKEIIGNVVKAKSSIYSGVEGIRLNGNFKKCESICSRTFHIADIRHMFASFTFRVALCVV